MVKKLKNDKGLLMDPRDWLEKDIKKLSPKNYNEMIFYIVKCAGGIITYQQAALQIKEIVKYKEGEDD